MRRELNFILFFSVFGQEPDDECTEDNLPEINFSKWNCQMENSKKRFCLLSCDEGKSRHIYFSVEFVS